MFCYNCGCHLSEQDYCTSCGADVAVYKKLMAMSNLLYNQGLERAKVRDLTGAVSSLRQSLKFNKSNIEARNLLGLVYFEMGESVAALSEWVISQNFRGEKNIANEYINLIRSNTTRLDTITQTIRKYNQAYQYCLQDSKDLAIIQLRRVLSLNSKFLRAHQLLALLYLDAEEYEKARRELVRCLNIDCNNTLSLRYMKIIDEVMAAQDSERVVHGGKKEEALRYQSDNEVIIQPLNVKEAKSGAFATIVNIIIGLIIGAAAMYMLGVRTIKQDTRNDSKEEIEKIVNQLDAKTLEIQGLQGKIASLQGRNDDLEKELVRYVGEDGTLSTIDNLLAAASSYLETGDIHATADCLEAIRENVNLTPEEGEEAAISEQFLTLYNALFHAVGPTLSEEYSAEGYKAGREERYEDAAAFYEQAYYYDASNVQALYDLGNAYRRMEQQDKALEAYNRILELHAESDLARKAKQAKESLLKEMTNE